MTPYALLLAEDTPTKPPPIPPTQPCTPVEQAQHRAELLAALADFHWHDEPRISQTRRGRPHQTPQHPHNSPTHPHAA